MLKSEVWGSIIVVIMLAIISARFAPFTAAVYTVIIAGFILWCSLRVLKNLEQIEQKLEEQKKTESAERPEE